MHAFARCCLILTVLALAACTRTSPEERIAKFRERSYQNASQWIDRAATQGETELRLIGTGWLNRVPPSVGTLRQLEVLVIGDTAVDTLPLEIGQLTRLEYLYLSNNRIRDLPPSIVNLRNLKVIELSGNPISAEELGRIQEWLPDTAVVYFGNFRVKPVGDMQFERLEEDGPERPVQHAGCLAGDWEACYEVSGRFSILGFPSIYYTMLACLHAERSLEENPRPVFDHSPEVRNCNTGAGFVLDHVYDQERVLRVTDMESRAPFSPRLVGPVHLADALWRRGCRMLGEPDCETYETAASFELESVQRRLAFRQQFQAEDRRQTAAMRAEMWNTVLNTANAVGAVHRRNAQLVQGAATSQTVFDSEGEPIDLGMDNEPSPPNSTGYSSPQCRECDRAHQIMMTELQNASVPQQRAFYDAAATLCECHLKNGYCGSTRAGLERCIRENRAKAAQLGN